MPITETSTLLNNCGIHALIPQLMSQIRKINDNAEFPIEMRAFEAQYEWLKTLFADFYRFDPKNFAWQDFREHLPSGHNIAFGRNRSQGKLGNGIVGNLRESVFAFPHFV